jgi:hypothetical protein
MDLAVPVPIAIGLTMADKQCGERNPKVMDVNRITVRPTAQAKRLLRLSLQPEPLE